MKKLILFSLLFLSVISYSQRKAQDLGTFTLAKLSEIKSVGGLVKDLPQEYKSISVEVTAVIKGMLRVVLHKNDQFNKEILDILKNADVGSKIYFDVIVDGQKDKMKPYSILVANQS